MSCASLHDLEAVHDRHVKVEQGHGARTVGANPNAVKIPIAHRSDSTTGDSQRLINALISA